MSKPHVAPNGDIIFTKRQIDWWRREKAEKARRDHIAIMHYAVSKGRAEGLAEGEARGEARGRAEGIAEGETRGRAEGKAEVALTMLQQGMKPETVATIFGLPLATIQKLANK